MLVKPGAVMVLDPEPRVLVWNAQAEELWGVRAEEVLGTVKGAIVTMEAVDVEGRLRVQQD